MIYLDDELCKGCYICIDICPVHVYSKSDKYNLRGVCIPLYDTEKCIKCRLCTLMCPDQVITIEDD